jgi:NADH-quinone oxidoreductase subunit G
VRLTIDGKEIEVPKGTLIIRAAEQLGIVIPRFCDHPLLDPVAACRQCIVEVEGQRKPMTACSTTVMPDAVVKTHLTSDMAREAQEGQLEFLLINHPLDCPQCDKGGECPLQDQTLAHGPPDTRMLDYKRRYEKPLPISPLIALDRERCVLCARCTRFSNEIAGDPFIELFERGALEQVAIYEDEPYLSYFSGNVSQICPVGALTTTPYRFKARPFDLRTTPTICNQCSAGCNLRSDTRRGEIQRQLAGDNMAVNEMWNCDRGRFAYEYVAHDDRLRVPAVRGAAASLEPTSWRTAIDTVASRIRSAVDAEGPGSVGVITGGRLTDEDAYAVSRYARDVIGTDNVDFRLAPRTAEERDVLAAVSGTVGPTYDDVEAASTVIVAGLDPEDEVPILYLRLRKAWRKKRQKIVVVGPYLGSLAGLAWRWIPTAAGDEARVLHALGDAGNTDFADVEEAVAGGSAVVLAGERLAAAPGALRAAAQLAARRDLPFAWVPRRNNARGAVDAGLLPGVLPGGRSLEDAGPVAEAWNRVPDAPGLDTRGMLLAAAAGELKVLHLIGVDPIRDFEDPVLARAALARVDTLIVQDLLPTDSTRHADILLPACAPQERIGSFTTWEGRRQPFKQAVPAQGLVQEDWDILRQIARDMDVDLGWETAMDVRREAAPLMESATSAADGLSSLTLADDGDDAEDAGDATEAVGAGDAAEDELGAVVIPQLLGTGSMLLGAQQLQETARSPRVVVNETDARRLGLSDGATGVVSGPGGSVELPITVSGSVAAGSVVLPRHAAAVPIGSLGESGAAQPAPLRVRVVAAGAEQADEEVA